MHMHMFFAPVNVAQILLSHPGPMSGLDPCVNIDELCKDLVMLIKLIFFFVQWAHEVRCSLGLPM
jgi:hypothetical protein